MARRNLFGGQVKGPAAVGRFSHFIMATGGRPLLRVADQRLLRGPFDVSVSITDNAVVAASLTTQSLWDKRVQGLYGASAATPVKGVLHFAGYQLLIVDGGYRSETPALKASLEQLAYLHTVRQGKALDLPFRGHISEVFPQFEYHEATNTLSERVIQQGPPLFYERPLRIDLETDQLAFNLDTAINWAGTNVQAYVRIFGHLGPKDFPGTLGGDADSCDAASPATALPNGQPDIWASFDPINFGDLANITGPLQQGYIPFNGGGF